MSPLEAAAAETAEGTAGGGAAGRPGELVRAAPPGSRAPAASLRDRPAAGPGARRPLRPVGALRAVEAVSASTHFPGTDQQQVIDDVRGGVGGGSGSVGRSGPVSPLHDEQIGDSGMQHGTMSGPSRGWRGEAVCRETDPELFFPTATHGRVYEEQVAAAKSVCARCPVRVQCLEFALVRVPVGIAGGLTEGERRALRRRQGARTRAATRRGEVPGLLGRGLTVAAIASRLAVSTRTAERWAAEARAEVAPAGGAR